MSTLALCPSRGRPQLARECLASFERTRRDPASRLIFVVDADDPTLADYPKAHVYRVTPRGTMGGALDVAARDRQLLGDATSVGMIGDDNRFLSDGWDVILDGWLSATVGIAYGDDGFQHERLPTSWWLSRPIVDRFGMAHPSLRHFYMDNYWLELGQATDSLRYFPDVHIEHLHPLAQKAAWDPIYDRGHKHAAHDRAAFRTWQQGGKALDVVRLQRLLGRVDSTPRRVFADWHHPALWESLRILLEERFGWQLYSPIGEDWTRAGWRFAHNGWKPADYLVWPDAVDRGTHFERVDPEYPETARKLVTVSQANAMRWDFVLSSVPAHQRTFADLARRWRARYIVQAGNAKHPLDRSIRSVVLASTLAVPRGQNVIHYHQEFDRRVFSFTLATELRAVSSLMLRLESTSCDWRWLADSPDVRWSAIDALDEHAAGYLSPASAIAERMRQSGWIWHDKRIGDGYGHIIHNAAAMGRPLIGHASHFAGQMGAPLWRDLETCIDLDRHPPERALRLFRAISADPDWHASISAEILATFDRLVDFAAEAERIRAALAV